jgi:hypothetical protein
MGGNQGAHGACRRTRRETHQGRTRERRPQELQAWRLRGGPLLATPKASSVSWAGDTLEPAQSGPGWLESLEGGQGQPAGEVEIALDGARPQPAAAHPDGNAGGRSACTLAWLARRWRDSSFQTQEGEGFREASYNCWRFCATERSSFLRVLLELTGSGELAKWHREPGARQST